jgi:hypothetical protein
MVGDLDVHDAPPIVGEEHQNEQQAARGGGYDEEIGRDQLVNVVGQKGSPRLRRRPRCKSSKA